MFWGVLERENRSKEEKSGDVLRMDQVVVRNGSLRK